VTHATIKATKPGGTNHMTIAKANRIANVHIFRAERLGNTVNGNPRYRFHTDHGTFLMQSDAALGYAVENYTNTRFPDTYAIGSDAPAVTLVTSAAGRVFGIEKDGKVLH